MIKTEEKKENTVKKQKNIRKTIPRITKDDSSLEDRKSVSASISVKEGREKAGNKKGEARTEGKGKAKSTSTHPKTSAFTAVKGRAKSLVNSKTQPSQAKRESALPKESISREAKGGRLRANEKKTSQKKRGRGGKLKVFSLGGLQEIGKNMTVLEWGEDIIVVDAGMGFPDEDMPGVDLVIPDISYLVKNANKIRGILITHGHEDHIGAVPYILQQINVPIYATRLTLGIIEGKLREIKPKSVPELYTVEAGDVLSLGVFKAEFIHVNHSIADACAIAIKTPIGTVLHTGDFKLDVSPIDGKMMDIGRLSELGRDGVELLLCESTNAERGGFTPSERTVGFSLERVFAKYEDKRIIIATFSSNVHRVQQIIDCSAAHGRKVAVLGRSMENVIGAAKDLGYMSIPEGVLVNVGDLKRYRPSEITLITTGSQGEPMSALYRIAFSEHDRVRLAASDVVVLSSSAIPGNERFVGKIINAIVKSGVKVVNDSTEEIHVSGHACKEEIKLMISLVRPNYFMPIHGEYRHLYANKEIGEFMGIPSDKIIISEVGRVLEIGDGEAKLIGTVPSGNILVDGSGVGDIGNVVLRDRLLLREDGLVVIVATVDKKYGEIVSGPEIVTRGFVYEKESDELLEDARRIAQATLDRALMRGGLDHNTVKSAMKDELAKFIFRATKRRPMILPMIMEI